MSDAAKVAWVSRVLELDAVAVRGARPGSGAGGVRAARQAVVSTQGYDTVPDSGGMPRFASAYGTPQQMDGAAPYDTPPDSGEMPRFASAYGTPEQADAATPYDTPPDSGKMPRFASAYGTPEQADGAAKPPPQPARKFAPVDTTPTPTGMKAKRVGSGYDGEHNQVAWRNIGVPRDDTRVTTKIYTEQERAANALRHGADGGFTKGDGSSVAGQKLGYAMDASGQMGTFREGKADITTTDADGNVTRRSAQDMDDIKATVRGDPTARAELSHHTTALGGDVVTDKDGNPVLDGEGRPMMRSRAAASAGVVKFDMFGRIVKINNNSGHYKPQVDELLQAVEQLTKQGAFFEDDIRDVDGNILQPDDKRLKLYEASKTRLKDAQTLGERAEALTGSLAAAEDAQAQADIAGDLGRLSGEIDKLNKDIAQAQQVLRKLGVAPSQKLRDDAKVAFLDVKPGMTPFQIKTAGTEKMNVKKFLKSGGGNRDALEDKKDVLDEIRTAGRQTRKALNRDANARADRIGGAGPAPDEDAVEDALAALEGRGPAGRRPAAAPPAAPPAGNEAGAARPKPAAAYADLADLNAESGPENAGRAGGAYAEPDKLNPE